MVILSICYVHAVVWPEIDMIGGGGGMMIDSKGKSFWELLVIH